MADNKDKKVLNVPALRFPEFTEEWEKCKFGEIATGFDYGMNAAAKPYDGQNKYNGSRSCRIYSTFVSI